MRHQVLVIAEAEEDIFDIYGVIYQIVGNKVFIHCVLDGRRNLQEILERRMLR